ncbi:hypothetical protein L226DRAFT_525324 [Lentinus tigrinus ALCF2SS1-7]|uniref:uncharacterized protein n=1 Tax=Lentinus tigrinus ALCF2SS1-7 TaxID=1328758 RepID=UPI001166056C|nr:hypothetical protein L226DRAFT_525324 [Lentinus tigrinus ALCF2SS1-7]
MAQVCVAETSFRRRDCTGSRGWSPSFFALLLRTSGGGRRGARRGRRDEPWSLDRRCSVRSCSADEGWGSRVERRAARRVVGLASPWFFTLLQCRALGKAQDRRRRSGKEERATGRAIELVSSLFGAWLLRRRDSGVGEWRERDETSHWARLVAVLCALAARGGSAAQRAREEGGEASRWARLAAILRALAARCGSAAQRGRQEAQGPGAIREGVPTRVLAGGKRVGSPDASPQPMAWVAKTHGRRESAQSSESATTHSPPSSTTAAAPALQEREEPRTHPPPGLHMQQEQLLSLRVGASNPRERLNQLSRCTNRDLEKIAAIACNLWAAAQKLARTRPPELVLLSGLSHWIADIFLYQKPPSRCRSNEWSKIVAIACSLWAAARKMAQTPRPVLVSLSGLHHWIADIFLYQNQLS